MGRVSKKHKALIEEIASEVGSAYEDGGDIAAQAVLIPRVEGIYRQVELGGIAPTTLIKGVLPHLWKEIGLAIDADAGSVRSRLFSYNLETRAPIVIADLVKGLRQSDSDGYDKALQDKLELKCKIPEVVITELGSLFTNWLCGEVLEGVTETEEIVRLILSIAWFTGRRPWSEVAYTAQFEEIDDPVRWDWLITERNHPRFETDFEVLTKPVPNPEFAEGWLRFEGNAKWTYKEHCAGFPLPLDIPVVGVDPSEVIRALVRLRRLEASKRWFKRGVPVDKLTIQGALQRTTERLVADHIGPILEPVYTAGQRFPDTDRGRFTAYHLRPLYAARMIRAMAKKTGDEPDPTVVIKHLLGHRGKIGATSLAYQSFRITD